MVNRLQKYMVHANCRSTPIGIKRTVNVYEPECFDFSVISMMTRWESMSPVSPVFHTVVTVNNWTQKCCPLELESFISS